MRREAGRGTAGDVCGCGGRGAGTFPEAVATIQWMYPMSTSITWQSLGRKNKQTSARWLREGSVFFVGPGRGGRGCPRLLSLQRPLDLARAVGLLLRVVPSAPGAGAGTGGGSAGAQTHSAAQAFARPSCSDGESAATRGDPRTLGGWPPIASGPPCSLISYVLRRKQEPALREGAHLSSPHVNIFPVRVTAMVLYRPVATFTTYSCCREGERAKKHARRGAGGGGGRERQHSGIRGRSTARGPFPEW